LASLSRMPVLAAEARAAEARRENVRLRGGVVERA
jgi:hypothetical protein